MITRDETIFEGIN